MRILLVLVFLSLPLAARADDAAYRLTTAATLGRMDQVRALLAEGVPVDARDRNGETALAAAAGYRQPAVVRLLLDRGANPNLVSRRSTPLANAAWDGELDIARMLLKAGADPNPPLDSPPIYTAALSGSPEMVLLLLRAGARPDPASAWEPPLHHAAAVGYADIVKALLQWGADPTRVNRDGETPLMAAARNGHADVVSILLPGTPDVAVPFDLAAANGHVDVLTVLLPHVRDLDRALAAAAGGGHDAIARTLVGRGARPTPAALHAAAAGAHRDLVTLLLDLGVPVDVRDPAGRTPLLLAAQAGDLPLIRALIARGADRKARDTRGSDALALMRATLASHEATEHRLASSRARHPEIADVRATIRRLRQAIEEASGLLQ